MSENQRTQARYTLRIEIEYSHGGEKKHASTRNLSLGGAFIETDHRLALGTRMTLKFTVPTQREPIEVGALVRWTDPVGIGVQFDGLRARDVWALGKLFEQPQP